MSTLVVSAVNNSSGNNLLPLPGTVIFFASTTAPSGWLKCNGASLNTTTYAALFAATGYTFGGSAANFNVPDLRGEFIRGWDDSRGVDSARTFGSFQDFQLAQHNHSLTNATSQVRAIGGGGFPNLGPGTPQSQRLQFITIGVDNQGGTSNSGESRPRNSALLACIKF